MNETRPGVSLPTLVILCGNSGSGKTTTAREARRRSVTYRGDVAVVTKRRGEETISSVRSR